MSSARTKEKVVSRFYKFSFIAAASIAIPIFYFGASMVTVADSQVDARNTRQQSHGAQAQLASFSRLDLKQRLQLEDTLTEELQRLVDKQKRTKGQEPDVEVKARLDIKRQIIIVNLSRNYLPRTNGAEWENLTQELNNAIYSILDGHLTYVGIEFLINGKGILHYYPDPVGKRREVSPTVQVTPTVVVAAGHGVYLNYDSLTWRTQRDPSNGITEDFLTPLYANELTRWIRDRSQVLVRNDVRSSSLELYGRNQRPWTEMAARYHLRDQYPNNLEICCSLPASTDGLREYDEDIRSRPLYANFVNADTLINLHSNAFGDPTVRGARIIVQPDRPRDFELANSMLCSMRELIQTQPAYSNFPVAAAASTDNKGENRLANMPSVIVETAFHTNPTDALALQDPVFRSVAMKGVEKGYRLHREGKACLPLLITSIPGVIGPQNTNIPISVYFQGNPQFPIRLDTVTIACPSGWRCVNYSTPVTAPSPSPTTFNVRCNTSGTVPNAVFGVRTTMVDADGVKSAPFDHTYTCARP